MISNKYINAIIATITAIAVFFTSLFYIKSKNITINNTTSSSNFTYLNTVFNKESVTEIDIEVDEDNWNHLLENATDEEYINANITVNGTKYYNVGIRAKGNSSLSTVASDDTTDRYSFKVKFDEYVEGQTMDGLSKIALNNIISDTTYMKEYLSYDLLDRMGVPTPAFAFTNITLNGEEWGLYFAVEVIEEEFIERTYGSLSGNLYKPEGNEMGGNKDKNNENMGNPPNMDNMPNRENFTPPNMDNINNEDTSTSSDMNNTNNGDNTVPPNMGNTNNGDNATPPDMGNTNNGDNTAPPNMGNTNNGDNATPPDMGNTNNGDNTVPPDMGNMNNGDMPTPPDMGNTNNGDNTVPPDMGNMNNEDMPTPPDMGNINNGENANSSDTNTIPNKDNSNTTGIQTNTTTNQENQTNNNGFRGGMMGGGGMGASNGGSLVYTDDNLESYSDIFDNEIFKTTSESDEEKVIEMIKNLNEGTNLEEYLNIDEVLRYFAVNTFLVNLDSYASNMKHNYYLYERDGVFEILPWDYNLSFGGFTIGSASNAINFPIDSPVTDTSGNSPLIEKLLEVDEYKETYHKYLQEIVNYVNDRTYESTINSVNSLISEYVKNDATAFYTYEEYEASIPELINFGIDRAKSIAAQLEGTQPSTSYGNIETTVNLNALGSQGGGGNKNMDKDMNMQKPNKGEDFNSVPNSNLDESTNSTDKIESNNQPQMPNNIEGTSQTQPSKPNNNNNNNNNISNSQSSSENITNNQQENMNNKFERPDNFNNNQVNMKNILLQFGVYFGVLLIAITFVILFKKRKFKA